MEQKYKIYFRDEEKNPGWDPITSALTCGWEINRVIEDDDGKGPATELIWRGCGKPDYSPF